MKTGHPADLTETVETIVLKDLPVDAESYAGCRHGVAAQILGSAKDSLLAMAYLQSIDDLSISFEVLGTTLQPPQTRFDVRVFVAVVTAVKTNEEFSMFSVTRPL